MRLFISAGEASGDAYGAALVRGLRQTMGTQFDAVQVQAVGGNALFEAGVDRIVDTRKWGAIGIFESLKIVPRALAGLARAKRSMAKGAPGLFVPIDYGFFNLRLLRFARKLGWKAVYFVPPGSWRRDRQGKDLPPLTDAIITPFSWSAELLNQMGANAFWFGHPLRQMLKEDTENPIPRSQNGIAILPGSRQAEVIENLPVIADAMRDYPGDIQFVVAPNIRRDWIETQWKQLTNGKAADFQIGGASHALLRARAGIICSGSATLQAALCDCPMVVIYRISKLTELEARAIGFKDQFISQPNILMDREIVPELIQSNATGKSIREHVDALVNVGPTRDAQLAAFHELRDLLGPDDAIDRSVEVLRQFLEQT